MKTVDTKPYQAQKAVEKLLNAQNNIYRPWQLHKHLMEPIRLVSTKDEFVKYLFVDSFVRPGFSVEDDLVQIPHLFCKIDGKTDEIVYELQKLKRANPDKVEILHNFNLMNKKPVTSFFETKPDWYDDETDIDIEKAFADTLNSIGHLRPKYRYNFLLAVNRVLKSIKSGSLLVNVPTPRVILETLIYNSTLIVDMYHKFDYQFMVPKFVVIDEEQYGLNPYGALRLMLMNELSFDIIIASKNSYSSIENIISPDEYELYIADDDTFSSVDSFNSSNSDKKTLSLLFKILIPLGLIGFLMIMYFIFN